MAKKKSFGIDDLLTDHQPNQEIKTVKKSNKKTTALSFDEDFLKRLKHYAVDNDMYMSQVIEEAVEEYIAKK